MLQFNFNWEKLSVSAGLTLRNFCFRLYPGAIGKEQVIDFLKALVRHIDRPLLIVWDRLPAHRSRKIRWHHQPVALENGVRQTLVQQRVARHEPCPATRWHQRDQPLAHPQPP